jgi:hypothetical protein
LKRLALVSFKRPLTPGWREQPVETRFTDRESRERLGAPNLSFFQKPPSADALMVRAREYNNSIPTWQLYMP